MSRFASRAILALSLTFSAGAAQAQGKAASPDIVGLRLGMSAGEVKAALKAYDPAIEISEQRMSYNYGDGVNHNLRSKEFISWIDANRTIKDGNHWGKEGISIHFTPMPDNQKVIGIVRRQENMPNPPTGQQYTDSLIKKYGAPTKAEGNGTLHWEFPKGKVNCLVNNSYRLGGKAPILRYIFEGEDPSRFQKREIKDLSQCAASLQYVVGLPAQPASFVTASMLDVEGAARGEIRARQWMGELTDKAHKARESKGSVPRL